MPSRLDDVNEDDLIDNEGTKFDDVAAMEEELAAAMAFLVDFGVNNLVGLCTSAQAQARSYERASNSGLGS